MKKDITVFQCPRWFLQFCLKTQNKIFMNDVNDVLFCSPNTSKHKYIHFTMIYNNYSKSHFERLELCSLRKWEKEIKWINLLLRPSHVTHTHSHTRGWDYNWRNGCCFSFCCPKWTWRSLMVAGKSSVTKTKVCLYWLMSLWVFFLHHVLPTVPISIFLLHVRPEEEVEQMSLYKHCVHILNNLVCIGKQDMDLLLHILQVKLYAYKITSLWILLLFVQSFLSQTTNGMSS